MWSMCRALLFAYFMVDVHYYIRVAIVYLCGKYVRRRLRFNEPSTVYGMYVVFSLSCLAFFHLSSGHHCIIN